MIVSLFPLLHWDRRPFLNTGKADYFLMLGELDTGIAVRWCGHPTALRPYYITVDGKWTAVGSQGATYRSSLDARQDAVRFYEGHR